MFHMFKNPRNRLYPLSTKFNQFKLNSVIHFRKNIQNLNANNVTEQIIDSGLTDLFQYENNNGYCGETSLQMILLKNAGTYINQYYIRNIGSGEINHGYNPSQLLPDTFNYINAAIKLNLSDIQKFNDNNEASLNITKQKLLWIKKQLYLKRQVVIGVFANEAWINNTSYPDPNNPDTNEKPYGDDTYDHIVSVMKIISKYPSNFKTFYPEDKIVIGDHGLVFVIKKLLNDPNWNYIDPNFSTNDEADINEAPIYNYQKVKFNYTYCFGDFIGTRETANRTIDITTNIDMHDTNIESYNTITNKKGTKYYTFGYSAPAISFGNKIYDVNSETYPVSLKLNVNGFGYDVSSQVIEVTDETGTTLKMSGDIKTLPPLPNEIELKIIPYVSGLTNGKKYNMYIYKNTSFRPFSDYNLYYDIFLDSNKTFDKEMTEELTNEILNSNKLTFTARGNTYIGNTITINSNDTLFVRVVDD